MFWDILGIEPTKNKKLIKKAYAALLKQYHPEEFPEEFQRINQAYLSAMTYVKNENAPPEAFTFQSSASVSPVQAPSDGIPSGEPPSGETIFYETLFEQLSAENSNAFLSELAESTALHNHKITEAVMLDINTVGLDNYLRSSCNAFLDDTFYEFGGTEEFLLQLHSYLSTNQISSSSCALLQIKYDILSQMANTDTSISSFSEYLKHKFVLMKAEEKKRSRRAFSAIFILLFVSFFAIAIVCSSDGHVYRNAPSAKDMVSYVEQTLHINLVNDTLSETIMRKDDPINPHHEDVNKYRGTFLLENAEHPLSVVWKPGVQGDSSVSIDYEFMLLDFYSKKYGLSYTSLPDVLSILPPDEISDYSFTCSLEDTDLFQEQFGNFLNDIFSNEPLQYIKESYTFQIEFESITPSLMIPLRGEPFIYTVTARSGMLPPKENFIASFDSHLQAAMQENEDAEEPSN